MSQSVVPTLPAPALHVGGAPDKWQREYEAFLRLKPQLLETHAGNYVVIHDEKVADSGLDDVELALRFFAQHGNIPVHVGLVSEGADLVARIPHYREQVRGADR